MANEVAKTPEASALPAYLADKQKTAKVGNIDSSDLIIPRLKLLQTVSPELETYNDAKAGNFFHSIAGQMLGNELDFIPIIVRKSIVLWAPRDDDRRILARSSDGVNWDTGFANMEFSVRLKGQPNEIVYKTLGNVAESGLAEFGTAIPNDPKSRPAATLTYNILMYLPKFPDMSPVVAINARSSVKPAKNLLSKIEMRPVDHYFQKYTMGVVKETGAEGPYFNYSYVANGYATEEEAKITQKLYEKFSSESWLANDEADDASDDAPAAAAKPTTVSEVGQKGKF